MCVCEYFSYRWHQMRLTLFLFKFCSAYFLPIFFRLSYSHSAFSCTWIRLFYTVSSCCEYDDFPRKKNYGGTKRVDGNRNVLTCAVNSGLGEKLHHKSGISEYLSHFTQNLCNFTIYLYRTVLSIFFSSAFIQSSNTLPPKYWTKNKTHFQSGRM